MDKLIHLDAATTRSRLDYRSVAEEIVNVLEMKRAGTAFAPERIVMTWNEVDSLLVMPAYDEQWLTNKLVTLHRSNPERGRPMIQGEVVLIRRSDGVRIIQLDGATVTAMRTAALSLVAIQRLGFGQAESFTVCGAGVQAMAHVEALYEWQPTCQVRLFSRNASAADKLADTCRNRGFHIKITRDLPDAIAQSSVVITATSSRDPFIHNAMVANDRVTKILFVAVGAYRADMAELSPELVNRVEGPIVVDTIDGAIQEAGDLIGANIGIDRLLGLEKIDVSQISGTDHQQLLGSVHLFKSVGNALWDLAAARAAIRGSTISNRSSSSSG